MNSESSITIATLQRIFQTPKRGKVQDNEETKKKRRKLKKKKSVSPVKRGGFEVWFDIYYKSLSIE